MVESGVAYITSKDGIVRGLILISGCLAFALVAAFAIGGAVAWTFAAYLISWIITLLLYFFAIVNLISKMECGVAFEVVDVCISVVLFFFCLTGSIVLAIYNCSRCSTWIAGNIFGIITTILYFVEVYLHKEHAPEPLKYLTKINGIVKLVVVLLGCIAFALLVAGGYRCYYSACDSGRQFTLAAYIICWCGSMIFLLLYVTGLHEKIGEHFATADFVWAVFSCVFCLIGSIVLACYMDDCPGSVTCYSSRRLAADVFGFFVTIAYAVEAFLLKKSPESLVSPVQ